MNTKKELTMDRDLMLDELDFICEFARTNCVDNDLEFIQLRSLWTAFCLRCSVDVDTFGYYLALRMVYQSWANQHDGRDSPYFNTLDTFDSYMAGELV